MSKLLSANFRRLVRDKKFWISAALIFVFILAVMFSGYGVYLRNYPDGAPMEEQYYNIFPVMGLVYSIFITLFLGTDYSDGTIRNKLCVGHTRVNIYMANFVTAFFGALVFLLASLAAALVTIPFTAAWTMGAGQIALYTLICVLYTAAFCGIFTLMAMLLTKKSTCAVAAIILFLLLIVSSSSAYNALCEPEITRMAEFTVNGLEVGEPTPNPDYVSGTMRVVLQGLVDFLPTGQCIQMANMELPHPVFSMISSVIIAVLTSLAGILAFRKKDLK